MKRIAIVSFGGLPLPPVQGGAVENLIQFFVENNESDQLAELTVFSSYHDEAYCEAQKYHNTEFVYIRTRQILARIFAFTNRVFRKLRFPSFFQIHPYIISIAKQINQMEFDCVVVENRPEFIPYLHRKVRIPIILHMHNDYFNSEYFLADKILKHSTKVLAVSDYVKRSILTINNQADHVFVLRNVIDTARFGDVSQTVRDNLRRKYSVSPSDVVFTFVGRTIPGKGVKELVQAFVKLAETHSNVKLMVIGASWFGNKAESVFLKELKELSQIVADKVIFTGYIDYQYVAEHYACSDVVVVPSIMGEAAPLTVLEAMAAGKPLIVSDSGGIPEHVNTECAIEVMRGEGFVQKLFDAMELLTSNSELRDSMGRKGKEQASMYRYEHYLKDLIEYIS